MKEPSPESLRKNPPPAEIKPPMPEVKVEAGIEKELASPEVKIGPEISNEQLDQHVAESESQIDKQAAEIVPEAETQIESSAQSMNVSPEMIDETKQEQGLDMQLQEIKNEENKEADEAKSEIKSQGPGSHQEVKIQPETIEDKMRTYENPADDPDIQEVEKNILKITNQDVKQFQEGLWGEEKKKEATIPGGYGETWNKMNTLATMRQWEAFVRAHPEKAEAYKDKVESIKKALEWEAGRAEREKKFQETESERFRREAIIPESDKAETIEKKKSETPEEKYVASRMESQKLMSQYYELSDEQDKASDALIANPKDPDAKARFWEIANKMEEVKKKREEVFEQQQNLVGELLEMDYKNDTRLFEQAEAQFRDKLARELVKGNPEFSKYLEMLKAEGFLEARENSKKEVIDLVNKFDSVDERLFKLKEAAEKGEDVDEEEIKNLEEQKEQLKDKMEEWMEKNGRENLPEGVPIEADENTREAKGSEREKEEKKIEEKIEEEKKEEKESLESRRKFIEQEKKDAVKHFEQAMRKDWRIKDAINRESAIKLMKIKVPTAIEKKSKEYLEGKADEPSYSTVWIKWQASSFFERFGGQPNQIKSLEITFDNKAEKLATEEELKPKPKKGQVTSQPAFQSQK